jgi:pSer/pThr/pTyr-binding forkhead associated (FHA) protein
MPKLILKQKAQVIKEYTFDKDTITIGSIESADVCIQDKTVSTEHATVRRIENQYIIKDLQSAFGTTLNGETLTGEQELHDGDRIGIADYIILFKASQQERTTTGEKTVVLQEEVREEISGEETVVLQETAVKGTPVDRTVVLQQGTSEKTEVFGSHGKRYLLAIYGPFFGRKYELNPGITRIGRSREFNDIVLKDADITDNKASRRQATITTRAGKYLVTDKRSRNRTCINRRELSEEDEILLNTDDEILAGGTIFRFVEEGKWDFSPPKKTGEFWVRLKYPFLLSLSGLVMVFSLFMAGTSLKSTFAAKQTPDKVTITKETWGNSSATENKEGAAVLIADLNGDGENDLATVSYDGRIRGIDGSTRKALWPSISPEAGSSAPPVCFDGKIVTVSKDSYIRVYEGKEGGCILSSKWLGEKFLSSPVAGDWDNDGNLDLFVAGCGGGLYQAAEQGGTLIIESSIVSDSIRSIPSASDIDGDGVPEILVGTETGIVWVIESSTGEKVHIDINDGLKRKRGKLSIESQAIRGGIAVGDVSGDKTEDIVVMTRQCNLVCMSAAGGAVIWDYELPRSSVELPENYASPIMADLDGNEKLNVVIATDAGGIYAFDSQGAILWSSLQEYQFTATPALADFNKDGVPDVIAASHDKLHVVNGTNGTLLWQSESVGFSIPYVTVGDVDNDGYLEIVCADPSDTPIVFNSNTRILRENSIPWGMLAGNSTHAGSYLFRPSLREYYHRIGIFGFTFLIPLILVLRWRTRRKKLIQI